MRRSGRSYAIVSVTLIIIIGKVLGFIREVLIADAFGAGEVVDSFLIAESSSSIVLGWLTSFAVVFTPIYQEIKEKRSKEKANNYLNSLQTIVFILGFVFTCLILIIKNPIIRLCAPGFNSDSLILTSSFFITIIWTQTLSGVSSILFAYLNCIDKRVLSNLSYIILGVVQLMGVCIAWFFHESSYLSIGLLFSFVVQSIFLIIISKKNGWSYSIKGFDKLNTITSIKQVIPVFISTMIADINVYFDRMFASMLEEGVVSVLHYSSRIRILFSYVFSQVLVSFFYPDLAEISARESRQNYYSYVTRAIIFVLALFVPLTIGCLLLSDQMVLFVYGENSFDSIHYNMVVICLSIYNLSLPALAIRDLYIRVFYVEKKSRICLYVSLISVGMNVIGNLILINWIGYQGLAISTTVSAYISVVLYYYIARKQGMPSLGKQNLTEILKLLLSSIIMGGTVFFLKQILSEWITLHGRMQALIVLLVSVVTGLFIYGGCCVLLKSKVIKELKSRNYKNK